MEELTLTTPSLLFSAVSLIMLAYTNRFLSYAQLVRTLKQQYETTHSVIDMRQIKNLKKRLAMTRAMQILGIVSLLLSVITMFFIYVNWNGIAVTIFAIALLALIASLTISIVEILISVKALDIYLSDMQEFGSKGLLMNNVFKKK